MPDSIEAIPQLISATADGTDHEIQWHAEFNPLLGASTQIAFIKVVTGTFKFNVKGPTSETNASYTSSDTVQPIPFINGVMNIVYRCTSAGGFTIAPSNDK